MAVRIEFGEEQLDLLAEKAIWWPKESALLISDTHFGKVTHFRKAGIAIPKAAAQSNFSKFEALLVNYKPKKVYLLGDLFHSELNTEWFELKKLMQGHAAINFCLVQGNHDILEPKAYEKLNFEVFQMLKIRKLVMSHEPLEVEGFNICGHLHPGVQLNGSARQRLTLACFWTNGKQLIMPAFGTFTGLHKLKPKKGEQVFVCTGKAVQRVL